MSAIPHRAAVQRAQARHGVSRGQAGKLRIKRAYEPCVRGDGRRILVERLWPRGMRKEALRLDAWAKDVAPSTALRQWFNHDADRWEEFQRRYRLELRTRRVAWSPILEASRRATVTLLYSSRDQEHNAAVVLRDFLEKQGRIRASRKAAATTS